jgi:hypothetical protein
MYGPELLLIDGTVSKVEGKGGWRSHEGAGWDIFLVSTGLKVQSEP